MTQNLKLKDWKLFPRTKRELKTFEIDSHFISFNPVESKHKAKTIIKNYRLLILNPKEIVKE